MYHVNLKRGGDELAFITLPVFAALCATWLSGMNFPEQNNIWHIPIVLNFGNSAEGPHDFYDKSFGNFVSVFWLVIRLVATEKNLQQVFISIQLAGNAFLSVVMYLFMRLITKAPAASSVVAAGFCFCYGLWGLTRLGYSEIFVTYATHSQFAIIFCLLSLWLLVRNRPLQSGILFGIAAATNLFMMAWSALAGGLYLVAVAGKVPTRTQVLFSVATLVSSAPTIVWALLHSTHSGSIPIEYFHTFLSGHIYAFDYPRAMVQTLTLSVASGLALRETNEKGSLPHKFGTLILSSTATLIVCIALPYTTSVPLLLLLHPLRFTSVVMILSAIGAGAILIPQLHAGNTKACLAAIVAVGGFLFKSPIVSTMGFVFLLPPQVRFERIGIALAAATIGSFFLFAPNDVPNLKEGICYFVFCGIVAAVNVLFTREEGQLEVTAIAAVLGAAAVAPKSMPVLSAMLLMFPAMVSTILSVKGRRAIVSILAAAAAGLVLFGARNGLLQLSVIGGGLLLLLAAELFVVMKRPCVRLPVARATLSIPIAVLMVAGCAKGYRDGFSIERSPANRDFIAAEEWARTHTPANALFLVIRKHVGFSLFSRRPVWWDHSQGAAVMWSPNFYTVWSCRQRLTATAAQHGDWDDLALKSNADFVLRGSADGKIELTHFVTRYHNAHYSILQRHAPKNNRPPCPEPT